MTVTATHVDTNKADFTKLELRTAYGPVFRDVSTKPPRDARLDEIPVVDLRGLDGTETERSRIVEEIRQASENIGFFYIINHSVADHVIDNARKAAIQFFKQTHDEKMKVSKSRSNHFNGYHAKGMSRASRTEGSMLPSVFQLQLDLTFRSRLSRSFHVAVRPQVRSREEGIVRYP